MVYGTRNAGRRETQAAAGGEVAVNQSATQQNPTQSTRQSPKSDHVSQRTVIDISQAVFRPSETVHDPTSAKLSITECVICLDDICKAPFTGRLPKCNHIFCFACIQNWSKHETTCPLCKLEFTSISKMVGELAAVAAGTHGSDSERNSATGAAASSGARKRKASATPKEKTIKVKKTSQADRYNRRAQQLFRHNGEFIMHMLMNNFQPGFGAALGMTYMHILYGKCAESARSA